MYIYHLYLSFVFIISSCHAFFVQLFALSLYWFWFLCLMAYQLSRIIFIPNILLKKNSCGTIQLINAESEG